jgi:uncharacterized protein (TIGR02246 family)
MSLATYTWSSGDGPMNQKQARAWISAYGDAWRSKDAAGVATLFTPDGIYLSSPFRPPHLGHDGIQNYWNNATESQSELDLRFGEPVVDGDRVAVEWWAMGLSEGEEFTLPGCLVLRFDQAGLCEELREYWHVEPIRQGPPAGWGI